MIYWVEGERLLVFNLPERALTELV